LLAIFGGIIILSLSPLEGIVRRAITAIAVIAVLFTATCGGHVRNAARDTALTPPSPVALPSKTASVIPSAERLVARDAGIALSAEGYTLSWKYENPGDYSQDGKACVEDVTPIAQHFGEEISPENEWIRVNEGSTETIGVSEITPIAMNWASEVTGYRIDGAPSINGPWNEVASITLSDGDDTNGRLAFSSEIAPGFIYYRIVTLAPDGDAAFTEPLVAPSNEPIIYGVSPISGYQHEEYTITATASGQEPLTYAWDFGGGGTPNTSSEASPTVTLADAGEYSATLTISNSYGPTIFPFTLTVSARDMWVHTWGGDSFDDAVDICTDDDGNIYVVGRTKSYGAGDEDALILKYAPDGTLRWARTWGGIGFDFPVGIEVLSDGNLVVGGNTSSFGPGLDDIYILTIDSTGELLTQNAWGTDGYEVASGLALDDGDNVYFAGYHAPTGGVPLMFTAKLTSGGSTVWAKAWGASGDARARCVAVDEMGNSYIAGIPDTNSSDYDSALLKFSSDGQLLWAKSWGGTGLEAANGISVDASNRIFLAGGTNSFGAGVMDVLLMEWNADGELLFAKTWGTNAANGANDLFVSASGVVYVVGGSDSYNSEWQGVVLMYDASGTLLQSSAIEGESIINALSIDSDSNLITVGFANESNLAWGNITGAVSDASAEVVDYIVSTIDIDGITLDVEGIESLPQGTVDTGGGQSEALIIKNFPR
jgi:PKD repeat protein